MIDPVTLLAAASTAFNGIKKAVEIGKEVQDVYSELSRWASAAGQLQAFINNEKDRKPGIFEKIGFAKSDTAEAFDIYAAQVQLREMEKEIHHMFLYGALQHLGMEGYSEFTKLRREVREKRERIIREQMERRKRFIENLFWGSLLAITLAIAIWFFVSIFYYGREVGKW